MLFVSVTATPTEKGPFGKPISFDLSENSCVWLRGPSGRGKTTIINGIADLSSHKHVHIDAHWNESLPVSERIGVLFQTSTLLDELTVAGNIVVALQAAGISFQTNKSRDIYIKNLLDSVGLTVYDGTKRPTALSGGMSRRACLAVQLAQKKHVIILDEPFTGLDHDAAVGVAKTLRHVQTQHGTALLLVSHQQELAQIVLGSKSTTVDLPPPKALPEHHVQKAASLFGTSLWDRHLEKLYDYGVWSLPLILLTFLSCGLAISMLSGDSLQKIDISQNVLSIVDKEVRPLIKMLTGEEANALHMMGVRMKVNGMLNQTVPPAKAALFAIGLTKLFVLEIGPLLTALLLCGRIGGSYAGKVATMQATSQNKLLKILSINPVFWSLVPAGLAALIAGPILTMIGTALALVLSAKVGATYGLLDEKAFFEKLNEAIFPVFRPTTSTTDAVIETITYPPVYHLVKAVTYITIVMIVAEVCARSRPNLTPRGVPNVITSAVVLSGLLVIVADWGFSRLLLMRQ